jgi:hypothetical protein
MDNHNCVPKTVVGDMAFTTPEFRAFFAHKGISLLATGVRAPWPNRAEAAVRLFKRQFAIVAQMVDDEPAVHPVTCRQLVRKCCWARNTQLTVSGRTPLELATRRRPPDMVVVETMNPEQLTLQRRPEDTKDVQLQKLALKSHQEARQLADLRDDLAQRLRPSSGPF